MCLDSAILKGAFRSADFQTVSSSPPKKWVGHGQLDLPMDLPIVRSSEGSPSASSPSWWASASRQPSARLGSARARATASPRRHRGTETGRRRRGSGAWGRYREKHGETVYRIILVGDLEHFDFQILGIIIPTDYFFQRGWNHQPVYLQWEKRRTNVGKWRDFIIWYSMMVDENVQTTASKRSIGQWNIWVEIYQS